MVKYSPWKSLREQQYYPNSQTRLRKRQMILEPALSMKPFFQFRLVFHLDIQWAENILE